MNKYKLVNEISKRSNRYGDKLIEFMDMYDLRCLLDATEEQLKEYLEILKSTETKEEKTLDPSF